MPPFLLFMLAVLAVAGAEAATPSIASGVRHSAALGADGRVRTWGEDETGVLGVDRKLWSCPAVVPSVSGIVGISAGGSHVLALRDDRTVIAWGDNDAGQIGDGTNTRRPTPVAVQGLSGVVQVAAGTGHSVARTDDGRVWEWGYPSTSSPSRIEGLDGVVEVSAGFGFQLARRGDGSVWAWGANDFGQLGDGTTTSRLAPAPVQGLANVIATSAGTDFALALRADGTVWGWGSNREFGSLGDGTRIDRSRPVEIVGLNAIVAIEAGHGLAFAIRNDGTVFGWGRNGQNQLGLNAFDDRLTPVPLPALRGAAAISQGYYFAVARMPGGTLLSWGVNGSCELGDVALSGHIPAAPSGITGVAAVSAGGSFTVALKADGTVWTFGANNKGQLGNTLDPFRTTPTVVALGEVEKFASSWYHITALRSDGSVWAWGGGTGGAIGDGSAIDRATPVAVAGLGPGSGVRDLASGARFTLARKSDGSVWSWGDNGLSQLGPRASEDGAVPSRITGLSDVAAIAAGAGHSLALRGDGTVWTWGHNYWGQLGDGTRTTELYSGRLTPMPVPGLSQVRLISGGHTHSVVLKTDGTLWAWGKNESGQLGDGTRVDRTTPVRVATGLEDVVAISAGGSYTLALKRDGTVWGWGASYQLGGASGAATERPLRVPGLSGIAAIMANHHSLALASDGSVLAWGFNPVGQIGDGTLVNRESPAVVLREGGGGSFAGNDWFLDLEPAVPSAIPADKVPVFLLVAASSGGDFTANLRYRAQDIGTNGSVYVFARAPENIVKRAADGSPPLVVGKSVSRNGNKAEAVACVLAQLNASGQLVAVTAAQLQAYLSGTLSAQGASVSILNGVPAGTVAGSTFFVGYGTNANTMLNTGTNRSVVSVPGARECRPQAPQTGWWWNPREDGRGYSLEVRGNNIFFAAFLYDISGRSTWYVSTGPVSLDGSLYTGDLLSARGGQALGGAYPGFPNLTSVGPVTLAFDGASTGTLSWPGGTIPIERFNIVPNGLNLPPVAGEPESGWWWNEQEAGRGFFLEWQGGNLDIAGYMYDDAGNSVWYLTTGTIGGTEAARSFGGNWWSFGNGQTLTGAWKPNTRLSSNVAPVTITFSGPDTALMTLPNGRTTSLRRHRF